MLPNSMNRRGWLKASALGTAGFSASGWLDVLAARAAEPVRSRYKSCIVLWLTGGISHLESWDMKPDAPVEIRGQLRPAATSVPGIQICEMLPKLAQRMNHLAILRGMNGASVHPSATGALHGKGTIFRQPGVSQPSLGAAVSAAHGLDDFGLPTHVVIGKRSRFDADIPGAGFLGARHTAMLVADPGKNIENLTPAAPPTQFQDRLSLLEELQQGFRHEHQLNIVQAHSAGYQNAVSFMRSTRARAFDISRETDKIRGAYGRNQFGEGCLLARRLIEIGIPFVEVKWTQPIRTGFVANELPWDTHEDMFNSFATGMPMLDAGFSSLIDDLQVRGMLDSTLIVCMAEFGRTPRIERRGGRDHFGTAWSMVMGGGGIRGGQVVGRTNETGAAVTDRATSPADVLATVCLALGLDPNLEFGSRDGRPIDANRPVNQQMIAGAPVRLLPRTINPLRELLA